MILTENLNLMAEFFLLMYDNKSRYKINKILIHQQKISSTKLSELIPELFINWLTDLNHVSISMIIWNRQ